MTLTRETGKEKVTVKFNVTNTVDANESEMNATGQEEQGKSALKSRPSFTVEINRGGQILSFLCSYLPHDHLDGQDQQQETGKGQNQQGDQDDLLEDFQIDEFTIHDGEWNEKIYGSDCSVIDGELYDKLLNLLEEHGIGEGQFHFHFL